MILLSSILVCVFIILKWPFLKLDGIPTIALILLFLIKTAAGFLSFTYHNYYFAGGDGAIYLQGAHDLVDFSNGNPILYLKLFFNQHRGIPEWEAIYEQIIYWDSKAEFNIINDNRNAIRFNSLVSLFTFRNTFAHIVILNFITVIGLSALYKSFKAFVPNLPSVIIFIAVFLSPSILFWTSGILKETHTIFFIGIYFYLLSNLILSRRRIVILPLILLFLLIVLSRSYFSIILITSTLYLLLAYYFNIFSLKQNLLLLVLSGVVLILSILTLPLQLFEILAQKQEDFIFIAQGANSYFTILPIKEASEILLYMPIAIVNVFLQPQLLSFESALFIFPIIENIDILFFSFLAFRYFKKPSDKVLPFIIACLLIYFLSAWLIGLTVPVQGAIARYKAITHPFLLIGIFSLIDWERLRDNYFPDNKLL